MKKVERLAVKKTGRSFALFFDTLFQWRELHALNVGRSEVQPLSCFGRQRHKAVNKLRLTP
nr:MAG TPA: hypothetical protein [Caudoviricetes sp.]